MTLGKMSPSPLQSVVLLNVLMSVWCAEVSRMQRS